MLVRVVDPFRAASLRPASRCTLHTSGTRTSGLNIRSFHVACPRQFRKVETAEQPDSFKTLSIGKGKVLPRLGAPRNSRKLLALDINEYDAHPSGTIKMIMLNEPKTRNALSRRMLNELAIEIDSLHKHSESRDIRAVVVASTSPIAFCAGANLKERAEMSPSEVFAFLELLRQTFTRLSKLPMPSIAAIPGYALGGGLEMALCTTFRLAHAQATLGLPEASLGIIPGAGGTFRLPALIGRPLARRMMILGETLNGTSAQAADLVDFTSASSETDGDEIDLDAFNQQALDLAGRIAKQAPLSTRAIIAAELDTREGQKAETAAYATIVNTEDRNEALQAFKEKRAPVWQNC